MTRRKLDVRLLSIAEDDLFEIIAYIAADNPAAADLTLRKIEQGLQRLGRHPKLGRTPREEELARLGYRYLVKGDYLIFYTIERGAILIHRIIHGARDYGSIL